MKKGKPSIKQISNMTGFSPATVSNALNGKKGVNIRTAAMIRMTAEKLGMDMGRKVSSEKRIRFVIFRGHVVVDTPFFNSLIRGVESQCRRYDMEISLVSINREAPDFEIRVRELLQDSCDPILLLATEMSEEQLGLFAGAKCPVVVLDAWHPNSEYTAVCINNTDSMKQSVEYLMEKGHRKIGYLRSSIPIVNFKERFSAYEQKMRLHKISIEPEWIFRLSPNMEDAYSEMRQIMKKHPRLPTAFLADNDIIALGAMRGMQEMGIHIPEDVSVLGFDDLTFSAVFNPPLTTVKVSGDVLGSTAVDQLMKILEKRETVRLKIQICNRFIERKSVRQIL